MRMLPIARKTAHSLAVTRYSTYLITLSLTLLLTSCVPIPATPPSTTAALPTPIPSPAAETKAGFSDLASALAKADESDDIQQYAQLLDEFAACTQADISNEEEGPEYTESETVAVSIFSVGLLAMAGVFMQEFSQAFTEDTAAADEAEDEPSAYEFLEMALTVCLQNETE